jgi:peroxiredoxin
MRSSKVLTFVLVASLVAASGLVVQLSMQQRALVDRVSTLTGRVRDPYVGLYLPAVTVRSVTGASVRLAEVPSGNAQVLLVFSTTCRFCRASLPEWKRMFSQLGGSSGVEILGVSVDSVEVTQQYLVEHHLEFPVVSFTDGKLTALYRSHVLPQTLVIDEQGKVQYAHLGALTETSVTDSIMRVVRDVASGASSGNERDR